MIRKPVSIAGTLMPEMPGTGKHHGYAVFICGGDDFFVPHGATGLDNGFDAGFRCGVDAIPEWEKGIRCHYRTLQIETRVPGFPAGNPGGVHPAHLAGTDPQGLPIV